MRDRLEELRISSGLSKKDLAKKIGVSPTAYQDWVLKGNYPKVEHGVKLAELYGVTLDYLYLGKEAPKRESVIPEAILEKTIADLEYLYVENDHLFSSVCGEITGYKMQTEILKEKSKANEYNKVK